MNNKTPELIGEVLGAICFIAIISWLFVLTFHLTWGQAVLISYIIGKFNDELTTIRRKLK